MRTWVPCPPSIRHCMAGATVMVNCSASDETTGKDAYRRELVCGQSARLVCGYVYANAGEGESTQDLVFGWTEPDRRERHLPGRVPPVCQRDDFCGPGPAAFKRRTPPHDHFPGRETPGPRTVYVTVGIFLQKTGVDWRVPSDPMPFVPTDEGRETGAVGRFCPFRPWG